MSRNLYMLNCNHKHFHNYYPFIWFFKAEIINLRTFLQVNFTFNCYEKHHYVGSSCPWATLTKEDQIKFQVRNITWFLFFWYLEYYAWCWINLTLLNTLWSIITYLCKYLKCSAVKPSSHFVVSKTSIYLDFLL